VLTVLLATRNRGTLLQAVLESFCALRSPDDAWKLVVVDNGSNDQTQTVVASFTSLLPLQVLTEKKRGKNFALNAGIGQIEGDLTVLTDDDVFPRKDWLQQLRRAADSHPEYSLFGGRIVPRWEIAPPSWTRWVNQGAAYAATDPAWKEGPIAANCVWGPNMAVRSAVFQSGVRFDTAIGPKGTNYVQGGDTEFTRRLEREGYRAWHVPEAVVEHFVRKEQLSKTWVMGRAIRHGRGEFRLGQINELDSRKVLLGAPRYLYRKLYREGRKLVKGWVFREEEEMDRAHWNFNYVRGQIQEARAIHSERKTDGRAS